MTDIRRDWTRAGANSIFTGNNAVAEMATRLGLSPISGDEPMRAGKEKVSTP